MFDSLVSEFGEESFCESSRRLCPSTVYHGDETVADTVFASMVAAVGKLTVGLQTGNHPYCIYRISPRSSFSKAKPKALPYAFIKLNNTLFAAHPSIHNPGRAVTLRSAGPLIRRR